MLCTQLQLAYVRVNVCVNVQVTLTEELHEQYIAFWACASRSSDHISGHNS